MTSPEVHFDRVSITDFESRRRPRNRHTKIVEQLNQLEPGKEITYMLGEIYVKPFISVVRNEKGKKFSVFQDGRGVTGAPAGNRGKFWDTNDAKEIASWVLGRGGGFYSS